LLAAIASDVEMSDRARPKGPYSSSPDLVYVSKLKSEPEALPKSLITKIWNECLGPQAILFDLGARERLINHG